MASFGDIKAGRADALAAVEGLWRRLTMLEATRRTGETTLGGRRSPRLRAGNSRGSSRSTGPTSGTR